jgi:hypothetical protein
MVGCGAAIAASPQLAADAGERFLLSHCPGAARTVPPPEPSAQLHAHTPPRKHRRGRTELVTKGAVDLLNGDPLQGEGRVLCLWKVKNTPAVSRLRLTRTGASIA